MKTSFKIYLETLAAKLFSKDDVKQMLNAPVFDKKEQDVYETFREEYKQWIAERDEDISFEEWVRKYKL